MMEWSCAVTVNDRASPSSAATPEALSLAPCVATAGTSRLAITRIVPAASPLESAQMFCRAASLPSIVAAKLSMCVSRPACLNCWTTHRASRLSGSVPATRWGEDVCRRIRAASDVPIIMLTAKDGEEDLVKGLQLGADDYLTKPFSPRELTARVRALLRRARSDDEPQADVLERAGERLVVDSARRRAPAR